MEGPDPIETFAKSLVSLAQSGWGRLNVPFTIEDVHDMFTPALIRQEVGYGALVAPYFGVLSESGTLASAPVSETRVVQTRPRRGYLKPSAAEEHRKAGHVLVLAQIEDWNRGARALVNVLKREMQAQVSVDAHLSGIAADHGVPCISEAQVFVVQLEGRSRWILGEDADSDAATLSVGQVLYVPSRTVRRGTSDWTDCLYLVISVQQPTVRDLAELTLARFHNGSAVAEFAGTHHFQAAEDKARWLLEALVSHLAAEDQAALARQSVRARQIEVLKA